MARSTLDQMLINHDVNWLYDCPDHGQNVRTSLAILMRLFASERGQIRTDLTITPEGIARIRDIAITALRILTEKECPPYGHRTNWELVILAYRHAGLHALLFNGEKLSEMQPPPEAIRVFIRPGLILHLKDIIHACEHGLGSLAEFAWIQDAINAGDIKPADLDLNDDGLRELERTTASWEAIGCIVAVQDGRESGLMAKELLELRLEELGKLTNDYRLTWLDLARFDLTTGPLTDIGLVRKTNRLLAKCLIQTATADETGSFALVLDVIATALNEKRLRWKDLPISRKKFAVLRTRQQAMFRTNIDAAFELGVLDWQALRRDAHANLFPSLSEEFHQALTRFLDAGQALLESRETHHFPGSDYGLTDEGISLLPRFIEVCQYFRQHGLLPDSSAVSVAQRGE